MKRSQVNWAVALALVVSGTAAFAQSEPNTRLLAAPQVASLTAAAATVHTPFATPAENQRAHDLVAKMSLAQKAGQVIVTSYDGYGSPAETIRRLHLGGAIPVSDNISSAGQITKVVRSIRSVVATRGYPAFVGIDQEGGPVTRIANGAPSFMTAGAARKPDLTTRLARDLGLEMRGLGFTAVLAPVADMTIGLADPTIGVRSASGWPGVASSQVTAAVRGAVTSGVVPVLKHFPGHGSVHTDTHVDLAVQDRSLAELKRKDLVPFQRAIDAGAPAIMTGHIALRALAPGAPASLSWTVTTQLLRNQMGFEGLVITDSLGMGAIARRYSSAESAVRALLAGADVVAMPPSAAAARRGIVDAVRSGRLPQRRLDQAATRMIATLLHQQGVAPTGSPLGRARNASIAMTRAGLTQVAGRCHGRLVGTTVRVTGPRSAAFTAVARSEGLHVGETGPLVALATTRRPATAAIAVALGRPQLLAGAKATVKFATYNPSSAALRAVVRRLLGKMPASGRLPSFVSGVPRAGC